MDPPTFSGKGDFREWKRKIELIYEAKCITPEGQLTWTLPLLHGENRRTGSIEDYEDRFLDLSSRLPTLADAEAKYALINGLKDKHIISGRPMLRHKKDGV